MNIPLHFVEMGIDDGKQDHGGFQRSAASRSHIINQVSGHWKRIFDKYSLEQRPIVSASSSSSPCIVGMHLDIQGIVFWEDFSKSVTIYEIAGLELDLSQWAWDTRLDIDIDVDVGSMWL